jgi:hypothetical protein
MWVLLDDEMDVGSSRAKRSATDYQVVKNPANEGRSMK